MYENKKRRMCSVCGKGPESEGWSRPGGGQAVARAEGMMSPRGAICPSCYEFGTVAGAAVAARTSFCMQIM